MPRLLIQGLALLLCLPALASSVDGRELPLRHYPWEAQCRHPLPPDAGFEPQELAAWSDYLCLGQPLDMRVFDGGGGGRGCDPFSSAEWPSSRRLSGRFLRTILAFEPFSQAVGTGRVQILCALFEETVDLSRIESRYDLWFANSRFADNAYLAGAELGAGLLFLNSLVEGNLDATRLRTKGDLVFAQSRVAGFLELRRATVGGDLSIEGGRYGALTDVDYATTLDLLEVAGDLVISEGSVFEASVSARRADVGGSLVLAEAQFDRPVDARDLTVGGDVVVQNGVALLDSLDMTRAQVGGSVALSAHRFAGDVVANDLRIGGSLVLGDSREANPVAFERGLELGDSRVGGALQAFDIEVQGPLRAAGIEVADDLNLSQESASGRWRGSIFHGPVELIDAECRGSLLARGAAFVDVFALDRARISGSVDLTGATRFARAVRFVATEVSGQVSARGAVFAGPLIAERLAVAGSLLLDKGAVLQAPLLLVNARVGAHVDLSGSSFADVVDLTASRVHGALVLASGPEAEDVPTWRPGARLILKNLAVGTVHDADDAWYLAETGAGAAAPAILPLDLTSFTYASLGGLDPSAAGDTMAGRGLEWHLAWLEADRSLAEAFDPQPYTQLAEVLRAAGHNSEADEVLFEMRNRELRAESTSLGRRLFLGLQWLLIGYGHETWRSLIPFALLVALGAVLCGRAEELRRLSAGRRLWYSLDRALPVVNLGAARDDNAPGNWVSSYFYIHQIVGFVLVSFLVAGLSGFVG